MTDTQYLFRRRIKYDKLRSRVRRFENAVGRIFKLFRFFLVIYIFYCVYKLAHLSYWYFPSEMLKTGENIEILGNSIVSNKKIFNEIKKVPISDKPLYTFNPNKMTKELEKLPPIKRAYIRRFWFPARLVIIVQEVIPAVIISPGENVAEIAAFSFEGDFISREYMPLSNKGNAVKVLSYGTKDDDYEKWDKKRINDLYKLAKLIEYYSGEKVKYLDLRIPNNAFVQLQSVKIRLGVLDYNVFERIKSITSMMKSSDVKRLSTNIKYIDLSWSDVRYINIK